MSPTERANLYDLTRAELTARLAAWGFSPVHAARLWNYLYWSGVGSLAAMRVAGESGARAWPPSCTLNGLSPWRMSCIRATGSRANFSLRWPTAAGSRPC